MSAEWQVIGHSWAVDFLHRSVASGRLAHAYLLLGPPQIGKRTLALELARVLNCLAPEPDRPCGECLACRKIHHSTHPDVRLVEPDSGSLKIDQVRELQRETMLTPYEGRYRVVILRGFDQATTEAANCLLKTLEEPPPQVVLCLTASDVGPLLPTIVSRCQVLHLRPLSHTAVEAALTGHWGVDPQTSARLARLSRGRLGWAVEVSQRPGILEQRNAQLDLLVSLLGAARVPRFAWAETMSRASDNAADTLDAWLSWWRDVLLMHEGNGESITNLDRREEIASYAGQLGLSTIYQAIQSICTTQRRLDSNANLRLALEVLLLSLPLLKASQPIPRS